MAMTGLILTVFTLMNFVLAMIASVFNGILDMVAVSLGVSVADAGLLNTMYAYGAAFGVPILLVLLRKVDRAKMLKAMLFITILTTVALVMVQSFWQILVVRLIMGVSANCYSVLAISTIASFAAKERLGRSIAILIAGNASALVIGVPLTRALSSILSWQGIFWVLTGMMVLALFFFMLRLPGGKQEPSDLNLRNELVFFKEKKVLLHILFSLCMFVGYGALYTYITPYLLSVYPAIESAMTIVLVLLGMASFTGNLVGGFVSDHIGYSKSMLLGAVLQTAAVVLILLFQPIGWFVAAFSVLWIMSAWFTGLQLNTGIAQVTQNKSRFMISINSSFIQLGTAIGASLGTIVISRSGINHIIYITLLSCISIAVIQFIAVKNPLTRTSEEKVIQKTS